MLSSLFAAKFSVKIQHEFQIKLCATESFILAGGVILDALSPSSGETYKGIEACKDFHSSPVTRVWSNFKPYQVRARAAVV